MPIRAVLPQQSHCVTSDAIGTLGELANCIVLKVEDSNCPLNLKIWVTIIRSMFLMLSVFTKLFFFSIFSILFSSLTGLYECQLW